MADEWLDYWFDMKLNGSTKQLDTYAYGWLLDSRQSATKSWEQLITEVAPSSSRTSTDSGSPPDARLHLPRAARQH